MVQLIIVTDIINALLYYAILSFAITWLDVLSITSFD